jgi:hypothetical protein
VYTQAYLKCATAASIGEFSFRRNPLSIRFNSRVRCFDSLWPTPRQRRAPEVRRQAQDLLIDFSLPALGF